MIKRILERSTNAIATLFIILGLTIIFAAISFVLFTLGYYLITLILTAFFGFFLPFSWWYSLGAWLIVAIIGAFIAPGFGLFVTRD